MGHLLKPKPTSLVMAKLRYAKAVERAEKQYERAVAEIGHLEKMAEEEPAHLCARTLNCLINDELVPFTYPQKPTEELVDPTALAKIGAERLLKIPNFGHKCLAEVVVWLKQRGLELNP